jgi:hypothetical protein
MSAPAIAITAAVARLMVHGPDRVLVRAGGWLEGVPWRRACDLYGVYPDVVFIRRDGWMLGAKTEDAPEAEALWHDEWVAFIVRPETEARPITEWRT